MMRCLMAVCFWVLYGAACTAQSAARPSCPALAGGFIQYQDWMMKLDAPAWRREMSAMRRARMSLVIIQWLKENDRRFLPANDKEIDPTQIILEEADAHGMQVYIGLTMDNAWWLKATDAAYLKRAALKSLAVAEEAWKRYGRHRSFAGWYIPQETWDDPYTGDQIALLQGFLHQISAHCKALSGGKPVAFAPFYSGTVKPAVVEKVYAQLLDGAGIDILMPQDGVGARAWEADVAGKVAPYFRAFQNACRANRVALWDDLESFRLVHGEPKDNQPTQFEPTDIERLKRQLAAAAPFVSKFVTFDFFHYLSPWRGAAQRRLYKDYLREFVTHDVLPAPR